MPINKRSFFERLTGSVSANDYYEDEDLEEESAETPRAHLAVSAAKSRTLRPQAPAQRRAQVQQEDTWQQADEEGQLTVDVYQDDDEIVVQSTVAGVKPDDLDVQITREAITIRGKREKMREVHNDSYFYQELYWGTFSRSITLPAEIDVDGAEATLKNGLLTVRMPKLDRNRTERIKVKNE